MLALALPACSSAVDNTAASTAAGAGGGAGGTVASGAGGAGGAGDARVNPCPGGKTPDGDAGCQAICETPNANQAGAAWPVLGGCATHRGLAFDLGPTAVHVAWAVPVAGDPRGGAVVIDAAGNLYVTTSDVLASYDASGAARWTQPIAGASVPMISADGKVVAVTQGATAVEAFGLDGAPAWSFPMPNGAAPWVTASADGLALVVSGSSLTAIDAAGALAWVWDAGAPLAPIATASPDGSTFVMRADGTVAWLDASGALTETLPAQEFGGVTPEAVLTVGPHGTLGWPGGSEWSVDQFSDTGSTGEAVDLVNATYLVYLSIYTAPSVRDSTVLSAVGRNASGTDTGYFSFLDPHLVGGWEADFPGAPNGGAIMAPDYIGYVSTTAGLFAVDRRSELVFSFPSAAGGSKCGGAASGATGTLYVACDAMLYALAP